MIAVRGRVEEGIVPGGGVALLRAKAASLVVLSRPSPWRSELAFAPNGGCKLGEYRENLAENDAGRRRSKGTGSPSASSIGGAF